MQPADAIQRDARGRNELVDEEERKRKGRELGRLRLIRRRPQNSWTIPTSSPVFFFNFSSETCQVCCKMRPRLRQPQGPVTQRSLFSKKESRSLACESSQVAKSNSHRQLLASGSCQVCVVASRRGVGQRRQHLQISDDQTGHYTDIPVPGPERNQRFVRLIMAKNREHTLQNDLLHD
jgi:hypothetical protein